MRPAIPTPPVQSNMRPLLIAFLISGVVALPAQSPNTNIWKGNADTRITEMRSGDFPVTGSLTDQEVATRQRMLRAQAIQRHKQMAADTDKLLALAQDLNSKFLLPNHSTPTLAEAKKAKEIEKLAKRLSETLKSPVMSPTAN